MFNLQPKPIEGNELDKMNALYNKFNWNMERHHDAQSHHEGECDCVFHGQDHMNAWLEYADSRMSTFQKLQEAAKMSCLVLGIVLCR